MWIQLDEQEFEKSGLEYVQSRILHYKTIAEHPNAQKYKDAAEEKDGELEVDEDAVVSIGDDPGAYVMSWQWVSNEQAGIPEEE